MYSLAANKIGDNYLSSPDVTVGIMRHSPSFCALAQKERGTALHSGKDLTVSSSPFYPYSEAGPTSLGVGPPSAFASGRFCSHLCLAENLRRTTGVTRYPAAGPALCEALNIATALRQATLASVRTFLPPLSTFYVVSILLLMRFFK